MESKKTANSFEAFAEAVRFSVEDAAKRKNYTKNGIDGPNQALEVTKALGLHAPHAVCEIVYKLIEYLGTPRRVLLEKVSGWAFILWRETKEQ